jgi:hypothetical protein
MVAIAGLGTAHEMSWLGAASIILVGALAIWLAHSYSVLLSTRVVSGKLLDRHLIGETLSHSWAIVSAGILIAIPLLPVGIGLWSLEVALGIANGLGIAVLALVGLIAGIVTKEPWPRRILLAALSAGLGIAIVAIEYAVHH